MKEDGVKKALRLFDGTPIFNLGFCLQGDRQINMLEDIFTTSIIMIQPHTIACWVHMYNPKRFVGLEFFFYLFFR